MLNVVKANREIKETQSKVYFINPLSRLNSGSRDTGTQYPMSPLLEKELDVSQMLST